MIGTYNCLRCGHVWHPMIESPLRCPKCASLLWNKPNPKKPLPLLNKKEPMKIKEPTIQQSMPEPERMQPQIKKKVQLE